MAKNITDSDIFGGIFTGAENYIQIEEAGAGKSIQLNEAETEKAHQGTVLVSRDKLHEFKDHPYRVTEDEKMQELAISIRQHGILEPLLIRPWKEKSGEYEIVSGHRRNHAAGMAELSEVPVTIKNLDDYTATIIMVDSNNKREILLPSEKAWAYRMKAEALNHQGKRNDLVSMEEKTEQSAAVIGGENNGSIRTIQRYIRLTYLNKELLAYVDAGKLQMTSGYVISFLEEIGQKLVLDYYEQHNKFPTPVQGRKLLNYQSGDKLTKAVLDSVLSPKTVEDKPKTTKSNITIKKDSLEQYFSADASNEYMEQVIMELLEQWSKSNEMNNLESGGSK